MQSLNLAKAAQVAEQAADRARRETLSRFRSVAVETKSDGTPVTEADRSAEREIRKILRDAYPDFGLLGEEFGAEDIESGAVLEDAEGPVWVVDPIDGTLSYSRGLPLYSTLIALVVDGKPVVGLIDLPTLDERYIAWSGSGCQRNGNPVRVSTQSDLSRALVSHGDPMCFDRAGQRPAFERLCREVPMLRGYTDAFGHAQVLSGGVDAMVDVDLNPWDIAASEILVAEAGGKSIRRRGANGKFDFVLGSPALVDSLAEFLEPRPPARR